MFLDYEELTDGIFGDNIKEAIKEAPIFIMMLTPLYLQRSMEKNSWVREEIEMAINSKKHIIPVDPDHKFDGIPADTPPNIARIINTHQHSGVDFGQFLGATIDVMVKNRIAPYVKKRNPLTKKIIFALAVILVIAIVYLFFSYNPKKDSGSNLAWTYGKTYSEQLFEAANSNDQIAQYYLGLVFENGYGTVANASQAVEWYRKAAEQGLDSAQINLALCYLKGIGVTRDDQQGLNWLQVAADKGNSDAMTNIGVYYMNQGNESEGKKWLLKAQDAGNEKATQLLKQLK